MTLTPGIRLGPYEIVGAIGAGGMGEVYRARDSRLGREVAVKVLPASFASDPDRLRRFEQEARAVAALNHPNILAIHDIGTHDGAPFLVTELLEGETLRERLDGGPLPVRKAIDVAVQGAHGAAAAHEKGIIHRDLKPANIFLTADGRVKILDFGLAKLTERESVGLDESQAATRTAAGATEPGVVLGTVGYMSPEQVRGKPADARSDIFALGTILYEMLSGHPAFQKDSSAETMAAILKEDPPELSGEGKKIPPAVERIVRHCLEKNPAERFQSARDLAFDLGSLSGSSTAGPAAPTHGMAAQRLRRILFATVGTLGLVVAAFSAYFLGRGSASAPQPTFHQLTFDRGLIYAARFAPGGQSIYYSAAWNGQPIGLYSTNPDSPESRPLGFTDSTLYAVSRSQAAVSIGCRDVFIGDCQGTLAVVSLSGGAPRQVAENVVSADWTPDGREMAAVREVNGKFQLEFPLGKVIYKNETWIDFLRISPRGDEVAFVQYGTGGASGRAVILDRNGKQIARSSRRFPSVEGLAWAPNGKEVWLGATATHAWANAVRALSVSGKERVVLRLPGMLRLHDVSPNGQILLSKDVWRSGMRFRGPKDASERNLSWLDAAVLSDISSDGQNVAFGEYGEAVGDSLVAYMRKTDGSPAVRLGVGYTPVFSPDGKWVLVDRRQRLMLLPTGAGEATTFETAGIQQFSLLGWMPGGKEVYFAGNDGRDWRMYVQDLPGGKPRAFTPAISVDPLEYVGDLVSPDGKLCFERDLNGQGLLYPLAGGKAEVVPGLSAEDVWVNWSSDERSAYIYEDKKTHAEIYRLDLSTGKRQLVTTLAPTDPAGMVGIVPVRITPDGKSYAYSYNRSLSDLYLVEGVK